jgi:uncharacterized membrane protein YtjA (UPF0391 family)
MGLARSRFRRQPRAHTLGTLRLHDAHFLRRGLMLHYAVVFFVIAIIAAILGFGGIATGAIGIAKVLFVVFLVMAAVSFLASLGRRS